VVFRGSAQDLKDICDLLDDPPGDCRGILNPWRYLQRGKVGPDLKSAEVGHLMAKRRLTGQDRSRAKPGFRGLPWNRKRNAAINRNPGRVDPLSASTCTVPTGPALRQNGRSARHVVKSSRTNDRRWKVSRTAQKRACRMDQQRGL
jgi:hypothetical protein